MRESFGLFDTILILLVAAIATAALFPQLKLPIIIGYLLMSAVRGPHVGGLVPDIDMVRKLAELGVVFLRFTMGLRFLKNALIMGKWYSALCFYQCCAHH